MQSRRHGLLAIALALSLAARPTAAFNFTDAINKGLDQGERLAGLAAQGVTQLIGIAAPVVRPVVTAVISNEAVRAFTSGLERAGATLSTMARQYGVPLLLNYDAPIFGLPINCIEFSDGSVSSELTGLGDHLTAFASDLKRRPETAYDWVFPNLYADTTKKEMEYAATGKFQDPKLVHRLVGQFYEVLAVNANGWLKSGKAESQWQSAAEVSRLLARTPNAAQQINAASTAQLLPTIWAHIGVDLPRVLLITFYNNKPQLTFEAIEKDYLAMNPIFDSVTEAAFGTGTITPQVLAKLPAVVRHSITVIGVGPFVRGIRKYAWERFVWNAKAGHFKAVLTALPKSAVLTRCPIGAGGAPLPAEDKASPSPAAPPDVNPEDLLTK